MVGTLISVSLFICCLVFIRHAVITNHKRFKERQNRQVLLHGKQEEKNTQEMRSIINKMENEVLETEEALVRLQDQKRKLAN